VTDRTRSAAAQRLAAAIPFGNRWPGPRARFAPAQPELRYPMSMSDSGGVVGVCTNIASGDSASVLWHGFEQSF